MSAMFYLGMIVLPVIIVFLVYINWDWFQYFYKFPDDALIALVIILVILFNGWIVYDASN